MIDVTSYDDIQELLSISDFLISDYSSLIFDYAMTKRPCFLYTPDVDDYISNDRNLYFDIKELPFISVKNNEELISHIASFDHENYQHKLDEFLKDIGSYEDGHACEKVLELIDEVAL